MNWLWWGGERPRDVPQWAYTYLVPNLKVDSDRLSQLKCVERVNFEGDTVVTLIRIFDPIVVKPALIKDFASLDEYPEAIKYEGYMEKKSGRVHIIPSPSAGREPPPSTDVFM